MKTILLQLDTAIDNEKLKELADSSSLFKIFSSWENMKEFLPVFITAIVVLVVFFLLARFFESRLIRLIRRKSQSEQVLVANFFGKVLWLFVFGVGVALAMYVLGLGKISNSILGAAGITTFVVGFALKDIFENFLAGVIIAFDPPFVLGSWIQVNDIQGVVREMTLRQTMLKTFDGQDVFIPNSVVLKNPLRNYTIDGFLRKEFSIGLDYGDDLHQALDLVDKTLRETPHILTSAGREPFSVIEEFATSAVNVKCYFWLNTNNTEVPAHKITNLAKLNVLKVLSDAGHYLPADILEIKYYDPEQNETKKGEELRKDLNKLKDE